MRMLLLLHFFKLWCAGSQSFLVLMLFGTSSSSFSSSHSSTKVHLTQCIFFFLTLFKRCMVRMMFCCCSAFRFLYLIIFHSLTSIPDFYFNLKKCNAYSFFCVPIMCAEAATTAIAVAPILVEESCYRCCRCCCCWPVGQSIFFFLRFSLMRLFLFFT